MYRPLQPERDGAMNTALNNLAVDMDAREQEKQQLLDKVNEPEQLQKQFNRRAQESRKLFDAPPPKK